MLRVIRWFGDMIWVYLIPIAVVLNVVQPPLTYVAIGLIGAVFGFILAVLLYGLLIAGRVLLSLTQRRPGTPVQRG